jgi:carbon-monoxide dehydrogenase medium subunit
MSLPAFRYHRAADLEEAYNLLREPDCRILAGGTDLIVELRSGRRAHTIVDIKACRDISGIERREDEIWIGALTTVNEILDSRLLAEHYPMFVDAAADFACHEIRNRATIGGNLANAAPCAQLAPPVLVAEAILEIGSAGGFRQIVASEFFKGVGQTDLQPGEILLGLRLPLPDEPQVCAAARLSRTRGMDLPSANIAVLVRHPHDDARREVRIAVGSVAPTPLRLPRAEEILSGQPITAARVAEARRAISEAIHPRASSLRAAPYTKRVILGELLESLLERLGLLQREVSP